MLEKEICIQNATITWLLGDVFLQMMSETKWSVGYTKRERAAGLVVPGLNGNVNRDIVSPRCLCSAPFITLISAMIGKFQGQRNQVGAFYDPGRDLNP